jgi:hypothetical protein
MVKWLQRSTANHLTQGANPGSCGKKGKKDKSYEKEKKNAPSKTCSIFGLERIVGGIRDGPLSLKFY